ncbi:MAG: isoaspartyl peptidase/L-asparaginase family protein [Armatimonadota bacterium]
MSTETFTDAVLVIHGGAGIIKREQLGEREASFHSVLVDALSAGYAAWNKRMSSTDIVTAATIVMEDSPLFNAGRGSVLTHAGTVEMDAALMQGRDLRASAVTQLTAARNPIQVARHVMDNSPFVMLAGAGADQYVADNGLPVENQSYFITEARQSQLDQQRAAGTISLSEDNKFGTVGAVAIDQWGDIAAATSTGGMTNKNYGRVGDSPIIGAGTFADNRSCAISATGHGEYFIRTTCAASVAARVRWAGETLQDAAEAVVCGEIMQLGGTGGIIAIDPNGNAVTTINCSGMYRGVVTKSGEAYVAIFEADSGTWSRIL